MSVVDNQKTMAQAGETVLSFFSMEKKCSAPVAQRYLRAEVLVHMTSQKCKNEFHVVESA